MKVSNYKQYRYFDYHDYMNYRGDDIPKPKKLTFDLGDVVYIKSQNSIGVVIGCIDENSGELRTDQEGMRCYSDIRLATMRDFKRKRVTVSEQLRSELMIQ